jgi:hypothetical protein
MSGQYDVVVHRWSSHVRLGLFVAVLGLLAALTGMVLPVRGTFQPVPPGTPAPPTGDRCLALAYRGTDLERYFPRELRLTARRVPAFDLPSQLAYVAEGLRHPYFAVWRPAGPDSIDIAWHHSPTLRLPSPGRIVGEEVVGRGGLWTHLSLYSAMFNLGAFTVSAREQPCPAATT